MTGKFAVDLGWAAFLDSLGVRPADLLRAAELPEDLFSRTRPVLEPEDYFRLWHALLEIMDTPTPGLAIGRSITVEVFSPPLLAAFCSPNLASACQRLSTYKPLICPVRLEVHDMTGGLELTFETLGDLILPNEYVAAELVFLTQLARLATRSEVQPIAVEMVNPPTDTAYADYFGHAVREGPFDRVVFSPHDAHRPFLSANPSLFEVFDADLRARLDELKHDATVSDRLRAALMEAMPSGQADTATVAKRLGMSTRSLQRRLTSENTSFQGELQSLRERLARRYLSDPRLSSSEISFLLGYEDPNSFIRAFNSWTGTSPEAMRTTLAN